MLSFKPMGGYEMTIDDRIIFNLIIDFMEIKKETDNIELLQNWIDEIGIDNAFKLILTMYTNIDFRSLVEYPYAENK